MKLAHPVGRRALAHAACLASLTLLAACEVNLNTEGLTSTETRTFNLTGAPDLTLDTFDGAIEVHSWDRNEIEVAVEKRAMDQASIDAMTIVAEQDGNRVVLKVSGPAAAESRGITIGLHISPSARLRVSLPRQATLQASTEDGAVRVEDVAGKVVLRTGDGSVQASRMAGQLEIRTGDGSIRLDKVEGQLDLQTDDGRVVIEGKPSLVRARTGDGAIRVNVDPDTTMAGDWDLTTGDGSIVVVLPATFNAEVDAETGSGSVGSPHPLLKQTESTADRDDRDERRERRRTLKTRMGTGGHVLRLRTGDGSIRIED